MSGRMKIVTGVGVVLLAVIAYAVHLGNGGRGEHEHPGVITEKPIPPELVAARETTQRKATLRAGRSSSKQILFGDLHVHTTISTDAFLISLPMLSGEGAHPLADACDFARYCSALDFWSANDHAEAITSLRWKETVDSIRQCNAVAGDPENPDTVAFLGWEWTQVGNTPDNHYGHKNVIIKDLEDDKIPDRVIFAKRANESLGNALSAPGLVGRTFVSLQNYNSERTQDLVLFWKELSEAKPCPEGLAMNELPDDCVKGVKTPEELFKSLNEWEHVESLVIPHGTTWGFYTPPGSSWDKQVNAQMHDPNRQKLIEVFSGHGNSEEFRLFNEIIFNDDGTMTCPEPTENYLPTCWQGGEIIRERCLAEGETEDECESRAVKTRGLIMERHIGGHHVVSGAVGPEWLDAGQCKDCFMPSFNYRPRSSVQYILALTDFADPDNPIRFTGGFMASSDIHTARPGTGYKEYGRRPMTEASGVDTSFSGSNFLNRAPLPPSSQPNPVDLTKFTGFQMLETERNSSFFLTGGLIAAHSNGRDRDSIWDAMDRKEVYGTSGPRILLWFDLLNPPSGATAPMGATIEMGEAPTFQVSAVGSFKQKPGCPDYSVNSLTPERLDHLCKGECYNPSDERYLITRIEVTRIRPQSYPDEPVENLIEDKWKTFECPANEDGCTITFTDYDFADSERDAVYYVRAIQEETLAVNADNLRCEYDDNGQCKKANICSGSTGRTDYDDDCLAPAEERAWSSPIFVNYNNG